MSARSTVLVSRRIADPEHKIGRSNGLYHRVVDDLDTLIQV
jgi:hypothetical protein